VALCKRRGFIFGASDIYGGINGFWDYGPLGVELKNNLRDLWWKKMVLTPPIGPDGQPVDIVGLDSAIIQNPKVWVASGHVGGFSDPMVDCKETKKRYRADHLKVYLATDENGRAKDAGFAFEDGTPFDVIKKKITKIVPNIPISEFTVTDIDTVYNQGNLPQVISPEGKTRDSLTPPKAFNLLFETKIGGANG
jgi:glycyl-tRNA synthetase